MNLSLTLFLTLVRHTSLILLLALAPLTASLAQDDAAADDNQTQTNAVSEQQQSEQQPTEQEQQQADSETDDDNRDGRDNDGFVPSEEISEDLSVAFPVDI